MDASQRQACQPRGDVNPLLFVVFCPQCVLSGLFALGATGVVTVPPLFGMAPETWLAPSLIFGTFLAWLAWGAWARRRSCEPGETASATARSAQ